MRVLSTSLLDVQQLEADLAAIKAEWGSIQGLLHCAGYADFDTPPFIRKQVDKIAKEEGLDKVFEEAGFEWRKPGCSMCLAMSPDKLVGEEVCASSSNRNFMGRQGSPTGRTILMSPIMVAASAISGSVSDAREIFGLSEEVA